MIQVTNLKQKTMSKNPNITECEERIVTLHKELSELKSQKKTPELRDKIEKLITRINRNKRWITEFNQ